jgi:hypothetical protein
MTAAIAQAQRVLRANPATREQSFSGGYTIEHLLDVSYGERVSRQQRYKVTPVTPGMFREQTRSPFCILQTAYGGYRLGDTRDAMSFINNVYNLINVSHSLMQTCVDIGAATPEVFATLYLTKRTLLVGYGVEEFRVSRFCSALRTFRSSLGSAT